MWKVYVNLKAFQIHEQTDAPANLVPIQPLLIRGRASVDAGADLNN